MFHSSLIRQGVCRAMLAVVTVLLTSSQAAVVNNASWDGPGNTFQEQLTARTLGASAPIVNSSDQLTGDAIWQLSRGPGIDSVATIVVEIAGFASQNEFGLYARGSDGSATAFAKLFGGSDGAGDRSTIQIKRDGTSLVVDGQRYRGFDPGNFGFYLKTPQHNTFYSDPNLNLPQTINGSTERDYMATYRGSQGRQIWIGALGASGDHWKGWGANDYVLAWEDLLLSRGDRDYQDFVVLMQSNGGILSPVPEASTIIAGAGALLILGVSGWRARKR